MSITKAVLGFSLIELLVTLSISMILLGFTITTLKEFYEHTQAEVISTQLMRAITLAQSTAINRQAQVVLCQSQDQKNCSGEWQQGFIIKAEQQIIFSFLNPKSNAHLYWRAFPFYFSDLEFLPSGLPRFQNGTFWYCLNGEKKPQWAIILSQAGRARLVSAQDGAIIDEKKQPLVC